MKKNFLSALLASGVCVMLLLKSAELSEGIRKGLSVCSNSVIPSLFPFVALSVFICKSSGADFFEKIFRPAAGILKIPEECGGILLSALIGGYPSAAKCINDYVSEGIIDRKTAGRMLCFCVNPGPPFVLLTVGISVFGNIKAGIIILLSQLAASFAAGIILSFFSKRPEKTACGKKRCRKSDAAVVVESVSAAAESCFRMCAFVVLAFGLLEAVKNSPAFLPVENNPVISAAVYGLFEVTSGCFSCADVRGFSGIVLAGAILSFSGISVILQIAAITEESKIPLFPFILSRFINAAVTAGIIRFFLFFSKEEAAVFMINGNYARGVLSASVPAAVSLLCMASLFLLSVVPKKTEKEPLLSRIRNKIILFCNSQNR